MLVLQLLGLINLHTSTCDVDCRGDDDSAVLQAALRSCASVRVLGNTSCTAGPLSVPSNTALVVDGKLVALSRHLWPKKPRKPDLADPRGTSNSSIQVM